MQTDGNKAVFLLLYNVCVIMTSLMSSRCSAFRDSYSDSQTGGGSGSFELISHGGGGRRLQFFGGIFTTGFPGPATTTAAPGTTAGGGGGGGTTAGGGGGVTAAAGAGIEKIEDIDTILTLDEIYDILKGNSDPTPGAIGDGWDNLNIVYVLQHYETPTPWLMTLWGRVITGIAGGLFAIFFGVLLYAVYTCGKKRMTIDPRRQEDPRRRSRGRGRQQRRSYPRPYTPPTPPPPQQPPVPQIILLNVGGGGSGSGSGGGNGNDFGSSSRSPRQGNGVTMVPALPSVDTPPPPYDVPEPVSYHPVYSARGNY